MTDNLSAWLASPLGEWAKIYIDYGFAVFPCHGIYGEGRCTCGKYPCGKENKNAGKHPFTINGVKNASKNLDEIAALFNYRTDLNIAIATGEPSGVFVIDIDNRGDESGEDSFRDLHEEEGHVLPATLTSITGSGLHRFYKLPRHLT